MSAPRSSAPATRAGSRPQARIGRYRVVSRLGRGGMGMVYRGLDEALEREVAVKTLTAEGTFDEENRRRFEIEAKAAAKLQHPNIVTVYELGEDRDETEDDAHRRDDDAGHLHLHHSRVWRRHDEHAALAQDQARVHPHSYIGAACVGE